MSEKCGNMTAAVVFSFVAILLFFSGGLFAKEFEPATPRVDVPIIIVGAGAAGLSAAQRLFEAGFTNVTILEAQGRTGGRISSQEQGGANFVELGAQYIHGTHHWLYDFANENDLIAPAENETIGSRTDQGIESSDLETEAFKYTADFFKNVTDLFENGTNLTYDVLQNVSVESYRSHWFLNPDPIDPNFNVSELEIEKKSGNPFEILGRQSQAYDYLVREEMTWTASLEPSLLSIRSYSIYVQEGGNFNFKSNISYKDVLDRATAQFPRAWLHFNKTVESIQLDSTNKSRVVVKYGNGNTLNADHVIMTVSLGVLKVSSALFTPPLPAKKQDAIAKAGFGKVAKVFLKFPTPFWEELGLFGTQGFRLIWTDDTHIPYNSSLIEKDPRYQWYRHAVTFSPVLSSSNTLLLWVGGNGAILVDRLSDAQVMEDCQKLLQQFLGSSVVVPKPERVIREKWSANPFFQGTYSYISLESSKASQSPLDLATPEWSFEGKSAGGLVAHSLLFAGEATHPDYFSTVHGAILSGRREADRIISYYGSTAHLSTASFITIAGVGFAVLLL